MKSAFDVPQRLVCVTFRNPRDDRSDETESDLPPFLVSFRRPSLISDRDKPRFKDFSQAAVIQSTQGIVKCTISKQLIAMLVQIVDVAEFFYVCRVPQGPGDGRRPDHRPITRQVMAVNKDRP